MIAVNLSTNQLFEVPLLSNNSSIISSDITGIHCMQASGDQQYLATGGANPNEIAVYKLPEITPYVLGQVSLY